MVWVLIFCLSTGAAYLVMSLRGGSETIPQRLERLVQMRTGYQALSTRHLPGAPLRQPGDSTAVPKKSVRQLLVEAVEQVTEGRRFSERLQERLLRADWKLRSAEFLVLEGLAAAAALGLSMLLAPSVWPLALPLGYLAPRLMLGRAERRRTKTFEQQMPDALAMMSNSLRSGYSFLQTMDMVSREMPDPIAKEFGQVLREMRVNIPVEDAVVNMTRRVRSADLDLVVTAVLIQRQVGGNLSEILESIAETIRDRIKLLGQIRTLTTQGRMSGWIVSLLPVVLGLAFQAINPGYLSIMFGHPLGWVFMGLAVVMQGVGILVVRSMISLEV